MRTLARAVAQPHAVGRHIRLPWRGLENMVTLRTKELVVVGGAPGGGKSTVAANLALGLDVPVLYCAQDSPASILSRMTALSLGTETSEIQTALIDRDMREQISARLEASKPDLVVNRGTIDLDRLEGMVRALTEWIGYAPPMVIIDNLIDLTIPGKTYHDPTFYAEALPALKRIAEQHDLCVMVLHHVTRGGGTGHGQGNSPIALNDLLYAGERESRHAWGVYNEDDIINIQVLKQQDGPADPSGKTQVVPLKWFRRLGKLASHA